MCCIESTLFETALSQGIWAAVAIFLFIYIVKSIERRDARQEEREEQYQNLINGLSDNLSIVKQIYEDVELIKEYFLDTANSED